MLLGLLANERIPNAEALALSPTVGWWMLLGFVFFVSACIFHREAFRRLFLRAEDPRTMGLFRIVFGLVTLFNINGLSDLFIYLFTDEGLFLTDVAREVFAKEQFLGFGDGIDPEPYGFFDWGGVVEWLKGPKFSPLFFWDSPSAFWLVLGAFEVACVCMIVGFKTNITKWVTLLLFHGIILRNQVFWEGTENVYRCFLLYLCMSRCGAAYSVDNWLRCRRLRKQGRLSERDGPGAGAGVAPGPEHPQGLEAVYRLIPAWPRMIMILQLAALYCSTGTVKNGDIWAKGDAFYYALNLDHFYRFPMHYAVAWAHELYITRVMSWVVHWWEILFPLALVGEALRGWDEDVKKGVWTPPVPRWTLYTLLVGSSVVAVWGQPTWLKTLPLFVLAAVVFVERRWFASTDTKTKPDAGSSAPAKVEPQQPTSSLQRALPMLIRVLSWACVLGLLIALSSVAKLGVLYYYTPAKNAPPLLQNKDLLQTIAAIATVVVPVVLILAVAAVRRWAPSTYLFVRDWLLGKRVWLLIGFGMHVGIDLTMNVGTFVQVMYAVYPIWLWGPDVDAMWRFVYWRAAKPGEAGRPALPAKGWRRLLARLAAPFQRMRHRVRPTPWVVVHGPVEMGVRRAALLRCWDVGERLDYEIDPTRPGESIALRSPEGKLFTGAQAGRELIPLMPGLWWLWPISAFPGVGRLALAILRQRLA